MSASYAFVTVWRVAAPLAPVWDALLHSERWPAWWRGVERAVLLAPGDENRVGALYRYEWRSRLPYTLAFEMRVTRVEPMAVIAGVASGELAGTGQWTVSEENGIVTARYDWRVVTTSRWMNLLAPVARPLFAWNHDVVMNWGAEGLARLVGGRLVSTENH